MKFKKGHWRILGHILHAHGQYRRLWSGAHPITLTFSVTARCQSRCLTCHIGECFQRHELRHRPDLNLGEIEKIFQSLGPVYFFNISGGEPFLRSDLPQIVELAVKYLRPAIVHIPTNALAPKRIEDLCRQILEGNRRAGSGIPLTVKPSIDGIGRLHDYIRGVPGNFNKLEETLVRLKILAEEFPELHVELGTVVSKYNVEHLPQIEEYVHSVGIESYRHEVAEERHEFFNVGEAIAPSADLYEKLLEHFTQGILDHLPEKRPLTRTTETLRLVYYELALQILKRRTQVIPCFGGISNLHLNFDGELWPCCVLAYSKPLGRLRELDYDIQRAIRSPSAKQVLEFIRLKGCYCPLANQWYSNILLHSRTLFRVILKNFLIDKRPPKP
jgi:MoaA/NifB/PqqE/SkfB family radical SAM enzyme